MFPFAFYLPSFLYKNQDSSSSRPALTSAEASVQIEEKDDNYQDAQQETTLYSLTAIVDNQWLTHVLMSKSRQNISGNSVYHKSFFSLNHLSDIINLMPPSQHFTDDQNVFIYALKMLLLVIFQKHH